LEKLAEKLFEFFLNNGSDEDLEKLDTISSILFRLAQTAHRLKTLEHLTQEFEELLALNRTGAQNIQQILHANPGLPPDVRDQIEKELLLLG